MSKVLLFLFALSFTSLMAGTDNCTSTGAGNFNTAGNWDCGHVPDKDDNVTLAHNMTLDVSFTGGGKISGNWSIPAGFSLTGAAYSLEFGSTTTSIYGTLVINNLTLNNGANMDFGAGSSVTINGDFTNDNNSNSVVINSDPFDVAGDLSNGTGASLGGGAVITVGGTIDNDGDLFGCVGTNNCCDDGDGSGDGTGDPCVLEISLLLFDVQKKDSKAEVIWITGSEIDNDYFLVQRSSDGSNFRTIGQVDGAGKSFSAKKYSFIDENPLQGVSYYRLVDFDFSGNSAVHKIVDFDLSSSKVSFSAFTFGENLILSGVRKYSLYSIEICDMHGHCIFKRKVDGNSFFNDEFVIPVPTVKQFIVVIRGKFGEVLGSAKVLN